MLGRPGHTANQFNQSVRLRTSLFNQVIYLNHKPQCSTFWIIYIFTLRALKSLILGGNTVALHGGTASLYWVRQLLLIPLGMTCDIDFVSEASLSCLTAEVVLNIYYIHIINVSSWFVCTLPSNNSYTLFKVWYQNTSPQKKIRSRV